LSNGFLRKKKGAYLVRRGRKEEFALVRSKRPEKAQGHEVQYLNPREISSFTGHLGKNNKRDRGKKKSFYLKMGWRKLAWRGKTRELKGESWGGSTSARR